MSLDHDNFRTPSILQLNIAVNSTKHPEKSYYLHAAFASERGEVIFSSVSKHGADYTLLFLFIYIFSVFISDILTPRIKAQSPIMVE